MNALGPSRLLRLSRLLRTVRLLPSSDPDFPDRPTPLSARSGPLCRFPGRGGLAVAGALGIASLLVACGGGDGGGSGGSPAPGQANCTPGVTAGYAGDPDSGSAASAVAGGVGIAPAWSLGPVSGGTITVKHADGTALGSSPAGADGRATLKVCDTTQPLLIEYSGGTGYFDESLGAAGGNAVTSGATLRAYVPAVTGNIGVTPLTETAATRLAGAAATGLTLSGATNAGAVIKQGPDAAAIREANEQVRALAAAYSPAGIVVDDITRMPAARGGSAGTAALADTPSTHYAMLLAAMGQQAVLFNPTLPAPALNGWSQFVADSADGHIDGSHSGAPVSAIASRAYDAHRLASTMTAAGVVVTRRHGPAALLASLPAVVDLGVATVPGNAAATLARLRRAGTVHLVAGDGSDGAVLVNDGYALFGATQAPYRVLFIQKTDGSVQAIGTSGPAGLLGTGGDEATATPVAVPALAGASEITIGAAHALARLADGQVVGWGDGAAGQLAGSPATARPVALGGVRDSVSVLAIGDLSFSVQQSGEAWSWGRGGVARGDGTVTVAPKTAPTPVLLAAGQPLTGVVGLAAFAAGDAATDATVAALRSDGTVHAWGDNTTSGLGVTGPASPFAVAVPGLQQIVRVVASGRGFLALDAAGAVFFWGQSSPPAGEPATTHPVTRIAGLPPIADLAGGAAAAYQPRLVDREGKVWRADGLGAEQVTDQTEASLATPSSGITTIDDVATDNRVNAAERAAGIALSGTISEPGRVVTITAGGVTKTVTAQALQWRTTLAAAELPANGEVVVTATFTTAAGLPGGIARRSFSVDTDPPTVTITSNGVTAGPVTFTFTWSEPVAGFGNANIAVVPADATLSVVAQTSPTVFSATVTPPASAGSVGVRVEPDRVRDLAGNGNATVAEGSQAVVDRLPPTAVITALPPAVTDVTTPTDSHRYIDARFRIVWSKPVADFTADKIRTDASATLGVTDFVKVSPSEYTLALRLQPFVRVAQLRIDANTVADTSGNRNDKRFELYSLVGGNYDASRTGEGAGNGASGDGSAGDGGSPGAYPRPLDPVTATRSGEALVLDWNWQNPADDTGDRLRVSYFQIIVIPKLDLDSWKTGAARTDPPPRNRPRNLGEPIPAIYDSYRVVIDNPISGAAYRIRSCRTADISGGDFVFDISGGFTRCRDSREFNAQGQPATLLDASTTPPTEVEFCADFAAATGGRLNGSEFDTTPYITREECNCRRATGSPCPPAASSGPSLLSFPWTRVVR